MLRPDQNAAAFELRSGVVPDSDLARDAASAATPPPPAENPPVPERTSPRLNDKIRIISLFLSVLIVINHSRNIEVFVDQDKMTVEPTGALNLDTAPFLLFFQQFFSGSLGQTTNAFFFFASGFFFFYAWQPTLWSWLGKLRKRISTLLLPYVVWSLLGMAAFYFSFLTNNLDDLMVARAERLFSAWDIAMKFITMPVPMQLWFMRDLMVVMVMFVPVMLLVILPLRRLALIPILLFYYSNIPFDYVSKAGLCFFMIGATLGYGRSKLEFRVQIRLPILIGAGLTVAFTYALLSLTSDSDLRVLHKTLVILGLLNVWGLYDVLPAGFIAWLKRYSPYRFFLYVAHEPMLTMAKMVHFRFLPPTHLTYFLGYAFLPIVIVFISIWSGIWLKRINERLYYFLSGGR